MKLNNKRPVFRILSLALIFSLLFTACTPEIANSSSGGEVLSSTPQETSSKSPEILNRFFFDLDIPGHLPRDMEEAVTGVREFDYSGGEMKANLYFSNGSDGTTELVFFLLCDGVPTEYTVLDSGETGFYQIFQVNGDKTVKIAFTPDFDLKLGRIDFYVVPVLDEKSASSVPQSLVVHAVLPEGYAPKNTYSDVMGDVENAQVIAMPDSLKQSKSLGTQVYLMEPGTPKEKIGRSGWEFEIGGKEETWICAYVPEPGKYRLVFLLDQEPFALMNGKTVFNCEFGEDEMFSAVVPLKEMIPPGEHSMVMIATRAEDQTFQSEVSCFLGASTWYKIIN